MRKLIILIVAAALLTAMAGCGTNNEAEPTPTEEPTPTATVMPVDFIFTGPKASVGNVVNTLAEGYMGETGLNIQWKRNTVGTALAYTVSDKTDIALVTREIRDEEKAIYTGLKQTLLCTEALAIVAGSDCPVDDITIEQLRQIFMGDIYDWADLGGSGDITVYGLSGDSSAGDAFQTLVLGYDETGTQLTLDDSVCNTIDTADDIAEVIKSSPLAIGFMPLALAESFNLKVLSVEGVAAGRTTVKAGSYPLQRPFYMVTVGEVDKKVQAFIDYCATDGTSKKYMEELGYILP
jgi:phosphate transport system substrate-binding protein